MKYTVKQAQATGKAPHPTFGTEYQVQFKEDDRIVIASKKTEPQVDDEWNGEIISNKYGLGFKKDPFVPAAPAPETTSTSQPENTYVPYPVKSSDGVRQGMCINNAANYISATSVASGKTLDSASYADEVHAYASALYNKGDLSERVQEVANVFGQ